jgi:hypothetical protein
MIPTVKSALFICLTVAVAAAVRCVLPDPRSAAGPSKPDETTGPVIIVTVSPKFHGKLLGSDKKSPAQGAVATLRSTDFLAKTPAASPAKRSQSASDFIRSALSDCNGVYSFDSIPQGMYCIEGRAGLGGACVFIDSIKVVSSTGNDTIPTCALDPPSTIRDSIPGYTDSIPAYLRVFGLGICARPDSNGIVTLSDIPQGTFVLRFSIIQEDEKSYDVTVTVRTDSARTIPIFDSPFHSVAFDGNGNTDEREPVEKQWYRTGDTVIVPGNTFTTTRPGDIFIGWNTRKDGGGDSCRPGDRIVIKTANLMYFARWSTPPTSLILISNGNGTVSVNDSVSTGITYSIRAVPAEGFMFAGWKVTKGTAIIADSNAAVTTAALTASRVTIEGSFSLSSFTKEYTFDSLKGYITPQTFSVRQTDDRGYVAAGTMYGYSDNAAQASGAPARTFIFLLKTDEKGTLEWKRVYNADAGFTRGYCVRQTGEGGYIVVGESNVGGGGDFNVIAIKTHPDGTPEWMRTFGGGGYDHGYAVEQTADRGFIISGKTDSLSGAGAIFIVKTDQSGVVTWQRTYDFKGNGNSIIQTSEGGYMVTGLSNENSGYGILLKINALGDILWLKSYWGLAEAKSVRQADDGGYFLMGSTVNKTGYVLKARPTGDSVWTNFITDLPANEFNVKSGEATRDGGCIISGQKYTPSDDQKSVTFLAKTDAAGKTAWVRLIGSGYGYLHLGALGNSVQETGEGGFILAGHREGYGVMPVVLIKTDANGNVK